MKAPRYLASGILTAASAVALTLAMAAPSALAENPVDTEKSNIDPRVHEDRDGIRPRGDYPAAQADPGTVEQHAEAIEKDALTPDKPADAGVDDLNKQQEAKANPDDAPRSYNAGEPEDGAERPHG